MNIRLINFGASSHKDNDHLKDKVGIEYKGSEADVFSLAVTLFVIVIAQYPQENNWLEHLIYGDADNFFSQIESKRTLSSEFKDLIISMFAESGNKRPTIS